MKNKIIIAVAVLAFLIILIATCQPTENSSTSSSSSAGKIESICSHSWTPATCTEPKTCTLCNATQGNALGHTTNTGICTRCNTNFSSWEAGEFVDEFQTPTGDKYISTTVYDGTFSNSATTNSKLYAILQVSEDNIAIMLWEYGNSLVKGIFDYNEYKITILDGNGQKHYFYGTMYDGGTRIYFNDSDRNTILSLLRKPQTLKIYLVYSKYSTSSYLFTIKTTGFNELYNKTF